MRSVGNANGRRPPARGAGRMHDELAQPVTPVQVVPIIVSVGLWLV
jgi:hypothetical protein